MVIKIPTANLKGDKGDKGDDSTVPGPRGLPGVNAVPADEAVAAYMGTSGTQTEAQLNASLATAATDADSKLRKGIDPVIDSKVRRAAAPTGTTDAAKITTLTSAGGAVSTSPGTYVVKDLTLATPKTRLDIAEGTSLRLPDGALAAGLMSVLRVTSSNVTVRGLIDGNRGGQDRAAFNAAVGTGATQYAHTFRAIGSSVAPLTGLDIDIRVINAPDAPAYFENVNDSTIRVRASQNGGPVTLTNCRNVHVDIEVDGANNSGWKVYPHAIDLLGCSGVTGRLVIRNQDGNSSVAAGTSLSNWFSGLTMVDSKNIRLDVLDVEALDAAGQAKSVGVSLLGVRNMSVASTRVVGYNDVGIELGGVVDSEFCNLDIDGRYARDAGNVATGHGLSIYNNAYRSDFRGRTLEYPRRVRFIGGTIRRNAGWNINLLDGQDLDFIGVTSRSSKVGFYSRSLPVEEGHGPKRSNTAIRNIRFTACDFSYNEGNGVNVIDGTDFTFIGCRADNNGQALTAGAYRAGGTLPADASGFALLTGTSKPGMRWTDPRANDTQAALSIAAFPDPAQPTKLALSQPESVEEGQTIKLVGAGVAGADLVTQVLDVDRDVATISTGITTFPLVAGAGTVSVAGTTLTGSGTNFLALFTGRALVKIGSETRRIVSVSSDTAAVLESAFTGTVSDASWSVHTATLAGVASQNYGYRFSADTPLPAIIGGVSPVGNTTGPWVDSTPANAKFRPIMQGQLVKFSNSVNSAANMVAQAETGGDVSIGAVGPGFTPGAQFVDTPIYRVTSNRLRTPGVLIQDGGIGVLGATAVAATTPGSVIKKIPVRDETGTIIGYHAVYATIT